MLPDSKVKPDHERIIWAVPVSHLYVDFFKHTMCVKTEAFLHWNDRRRETNETFTFY